jgi:hypothetical protein
MASHGRRRRETSRIRTSGFDVVRTIGLTLTDTEAATNWAGFPVLKLHGCFMAGLASHPSAEPATLVVRYDIDERAWLIEDAPDTYYLTDFYRPYPLILARLPRLSRDALADLLSVSWRMTLAKSRRPAPASARRRRTRGTNPATRR